MEVKDTERTSVVEEQLTDLPITDEQADEMNGGTVGKPSLKLFLCPADPVPAN